MYSLRLRKRRSLLTDLLRLLREPQHLRQNRQLLPFRFSLPLLQHLPLNSLLPQPQHLLLMLFSQLRHLHQLLRRPLFLQLRLRQLSQHQPRPLQQLRLLLPLRQQPPQLLRPPPSLLWSLSAASAPPARLRPPRQ